MNDHYIVTTYVLIDDMLKAYGYRDDCRASISGAEIMTLAVLSAKYFQNHHERAVGILGRLGYVTRVSISRFNRRLHQLKDWLHELVLLMGEIFSHEEAYIIDSMPVPVCKRARASRCKKVRGKVFCGYCAAKKEKFFGWRLHVVCTPEGIPVAFDLLPASAHDLTPVHELTYALPYGARVFGDKGYLSQVDADSLFEAMGIRLVAIKRKNMHPNSWADDYDLALYRSSIETVYSQMESMGIQRLHVRTHYGFDVKAWATLLALAFTNLLN